MTAWWMKQRGRMFAGAVAADVLGVAVLLLLQRSDESSPTEDSAATAAPVRGCHERVDGPRIVPDPRVDTVIGPMGFLRLPAVYRDYASRRDAELLADPDVGMPSMKSIGVLRAGARVTLSVPREQRRWLKVIYDSPDHHGGHTITLDACNTFNSSAARRRECRWKPDRACRSGATQFNGGFGVDFVNAPRRGLCAKLIVRVKGRRQPLRHLLFDPAPGTCGRHTS